MLVLRSPTLEDKSALQDAYLMSCSFHEPWTFAPEDWDAYIAHEGRYLVVERESGVLVGTFNISGIIRGWFQSAYLGYEVFAPFQGQGCMSKAFPLLLNEAFGNLNLHRLEANIQPDNKASIRLVEKQGFVKEGFSRQYLRIGGGEWKDHERWALLNPHWSEVK